MIRRVLVWRLVVSLVLAPVAAHAFPPNTEQLVDRTSRQVSAYLEQVSDVTCTEHVAQLKLAPNGHVQASEEGTYNYFLLLQASADDLLLSESRLLQPAEKKRAPKVSFLLTNGFSTLFLIFHPYYMAGYRFEAGGDEVVAGQHLARIHFTPIPGARTPVALAVRGREYPLALAGDAWIDPATGMVARIQAALADDLHDVGLRSLHVDVAYAPVRLPAWPHEYLFPSTATIEVETLRQHWRNVHQFTDYKSFMVGTEQSVADSSVLKVEPARKKKKK
jgi:hypothetical protein